MLSLLCVYSNVPMSGVSGIFMLLNVHICGQPCLLKCSVQL